MKVEIHKEKDFSGSEQTKEGKGPAVSFGPVGRIIEVQEKLAEVELKKVEAEQDLGRKILDAELDKAKTDADLYAAAVNLYKAFHPQTGE